jgi:hypothetical protein
VENRQATTNMALTQDREESKRQKAKGKNVEFSIFDFCILPFAFFPVPLWLISRKYL